MRDAVDLIGCLDNANVKAFLRVIRAGEGTADEAGYRRHFGGDLFESFADHPRRAITAGLGRNQYTSTAAGAYQFLARTWDGLVRPFGQGGIGLADFTPRSQDIGALALIDGRKALDDVLAGRIEVAIGKCAREWASLPGSPYGQPTRTMAQALATYAEHGGVLSQAPIPVGDVKESAPALSQEPTMPIAPIIGALLPSIIDAIPRLGKLFGSGSEVAERNVKAAELAVGIVQEAVGARNAQEAAEMVRADPAAAQAAIAAVEARWFELAEAGGGGIEGARKADVVAMGAGGRVWDSPSFLAFVVLSPLVYMIVGSVVGLWGKEWPPEVRAAIATAVVSLVVGGAAGYYWGSTTSRNRMPSP